MASVTHESPGWERTWREAVQAAFQRIVDEEAEVAAGRVKERTRDLGARMALQLAKVAEVQTMGERITISLHMEGLEVPTSHACHCSHGPHGDGGPHVCGLQGFDPAQGDQCPACSARLGPVCPSCYGPEHPGAC